METRICHICGTKVSAKESCPECTANFPNRRKAEEMTGEERAAELELWYGPLEIDFGLMQQRIEELIGRPVWTHELANKDDGPPKRLLQEARGRTGKMPPVKEWLAPFKGKPVIIIAPPESGDIEEAFEDGYGVFVEKEPE